MNQHQKKMIAGFTLIELSIVLIIIGLVTGAILVGHEMIVQAELRKVVKDIERYKTAVSAFRLKYNCFPGDCPNATDFWGLSPNAYTPSPGGIAPSGNTGTGNGNGDGQIFNYEVYADNNGGVAYEAVFFWQHLSLAGLIEGSYSGIKDTTFFGLVAGVNAPQTISNGGVSYITSPQAGVTGWNYDSPSLCCSAFGIGTSDSGGLFGSPLLSASEALSIDTKYDDGMPGTGQIIENSWNGWGNPNCTTGTAWNTKQYDTSDNSVQCAPKFIFNLE